MVRRISVLLFGQIDECLHVKQLFEETEYFAAREREYVTVDSFENYEIEMITRKPTLTVILSNGTIGLDAAYLAKHRMPLTTVFWFSDDKQFVMDSHSLNCGYFATKPVNSEQIDHAIKRCVHLGISLDAR